MQHALSTIDFPGQAEVWSKAQRQRTEEIAGLLKLIFKERAARFHRKPAIVGALRYAPVPALVANRLPPRLTP